MTKTFTATPVTEIPFLADVRVDGRVRRVFRVRTFGDRVQVEYVTGARQQFAADATLPTRPQR